ncbi:MAG: type VII secretion integral membrane protein EccD [Mycobacterium sp.]
MAIDDLLCRVTIQWADGPRVVDVALPRHAELGLLLPDIVDLVRGEDPPLGGPPRGWRLDRLRGGRCGEAMSLHEIGVTDGDVMVLSAFGAPAPGPLPDDPFRTVSTAGPLPVPRNGLPAGVWAGAVAVIALGYSGMVGGAPIIAAVAALCSAGACLVIAHRLADRAIRLTLHAVCIGFCCVSGFLAVPEGPGLPGVVLAAAAGCVTSIWLLRSASGGAVFFTASTTTFGLVTVVAAASIALSVDLAALGAALSVLALGMLSAAGRAAMVLAGLRPPLPGRSGCTPMPSISEETAIKGRTVFAGLVAGSAAAAALAVGMVAASHLDDATTWPRGFALGAVIAALLVLRARFYVDPCPRAASAWCGLISATAMAALATASAPRYAGPVVVVVVALAAWCRFTRETTTPVWSRALDIVEYVLLAAAVPLACWVAGIYDVVRSLSVG